MAKSFNSYSDVNKTYLKSLLGVVGPKNAYNTGNGDEYFNYSATNKKGKPAFDKATLSQAGLDQVSGGLETLFGGTANNSQQLGGLPAPLRNFVGQFGLGLTDDGKGNYSIDPNSRGWVNISTAQQNIPRIRAMFGDSVADRFGKFVEQQIAAARPENTTWKEMPEYQQNLVKQYMGAGPQATATHGADWGNIGSANPINNVGYQQPINPVMAPTIQSLFAMMPQSAAPANPLQAAIQQAGLLGAINKG